MSELGGRAHCRENGFSALSDASGTKHSFGPGALLVETHNHMRLDIIRMHTRAYGAYNRGDIRNSAPDSPAIIYKPRGTHIPGVRNEDDREWVTRVAWLWHNTCDTWPFICQSNFNTPENTPQKFSVSIPS